MRKEFHADYYQAIIQLRPADKKLMGFVERYIKKTDAWVSKMIRLKTGVDYYISSNKLARQIGRQLKKNFHGELIESRKLYSRDSYTSKNIYRVTVCFRLGDGDR